MPEEIQQTRLFLSGWPTSSTAEAACSRLSAFGKIVGDPVITRRYLGGCENTHALICFAHLTLEADGKDLERCLRVLNGAVWGGSKLKIEKANDNFRARVAREAATDAAKQQFKLEVQQHVAAAPATAPITTLRISNPGLRGARKRKSTTVVDVTVAADERRLCFDRNGESVKPSPWAKLAAKDTAKVRAGQRRDDEEEDPTTVAETELDIQEILRRQGFIDSDDDGGFTHGAGDDSSGTGAAEVDAVAEKGAALGVFGQMFDEQLALARVSPNLTTGTNPLMQWRNTARYDPRLQSAAELELAGEPVVRPGAASLTAMPELAPELGFEVFGARETTAGGGSALADMFTSKDPSALEAAFSMFGDSVSARSGDHPTTEPATDAAGSGPTASAKAEPVSKAEMHAKFSLLPYKPSEPCRFMRTESAAEAELGWKAIREQYTLDYKRRRRDTLRKMRRLETMG
jgi:hypothetical protein